MSALTLLPVIEQLISLGITVVPEIITAAQTELALWATPGTAPTAEQEAQIDAAHAAASAALQAAQPAAS